LLNDYSFWRTDFNSHGVLEHYDPSFNFPEVEDYENFSSSLKIQDVLRASEVEEEDPEEYVDSSTELYYEDGLLHKSLDSLLFDDEADELLADFSNGVSDEGFDAWEDELVDFLSSQALVYRAGQEADYKETSSSTDYSGVYGLEYATAKSYTERVFDGFYDELSDFY